MPPRTLITVALALTAIVSSAFAQYWRQVPLSAPYSGGYYLDVFFLPSNPQLGWACDQNGGYVIRTTNGGATWSGTSVRATGGACHLEYIEFLTPAIGYCSGPCGAFKSVDSGKTWTQLTFPDTVPRWGGQFRSTTTGWFVGGTCGRNHFYRTTDGGSTFSVFIDSTTSTTTTMADPYWDANLPTDVVYASGNGRIFRSTDDGVTWSSWVTTGTTSPWQEEIHRFGNTWAVSTATSNCAGGGFTGGGARVSPDGGANWREFNPGKQMFGVNFVSATTGWMAGEAGSVYMTTDAGLTWTLRNCGLGDNNMDDITFLNSTTGWVVGEGVYKLSPALRTASDSVIVFGPTCPDSIVRDTVFFENFNFDPSTWTVSLTGVDAAHFGIATTVGPTIPSCGRVPVVVTYKPTAPGNHTAALSVSVQGPDTTLSVLLRGSRQNLAANPSDTVITMTVRVGSSEERSIFWTTSGGGPETIAAIVRDSGDTTITSISRTPIPVGPGVATTTFRGTPTDTGWTEARFLIRINPCGRDTFVTVRVYGISPILECPASVQEDLVCAARDTFRVPVRNGGNAPLNITTMVLQGPGAGAFRILGWVSGRPTVPIVISEKATDTLLVEVTSRSTDDRCNVQFANDDASLIRGRKNPWNLALRAVSNRSATLINDRDLDMGTICPYDTATHDVTITNNSPNATTYTWSHSIPDVSGLPTTSFVLAGGQRRTFTVRYVGNTLGPFLDTLYLRSTPCDTTLTVVVRGAVRSVGLVMTPDFIDDSAASGTTITKRVVVRPVGVDSMTVTSIVLDPLSGDVTVGTVPALPSRLGPRDSIVVTVTYRAKGQSLVIGRLRANASLPCQADTSIPVKLKSLFEDLAVSRSVISHIQTCTATEVFDTVEVSWKGLAPLALTAPTIVPNDGTFRVVEPTMDFTIPSDGSARIIVATTPQAGTRTAVLSTRAAANNIDISIPLEARLDVTSIQAQQTTFNFGVVTACDLPLDSSTTIVQSGTIPAAVTVSPTLAVTGLDLVVSGSSVTVTCTPAQLPPGMSTATWTLVDAECGSSFTITASAESIAGRLVMEQNTDVGIHLVGTTVDTFVIIYNPSSEPRRIDGLRFVPTTPAWTFIGTAPIGQTLQPGDTVRVPIRYTATAAERNQAQLVLEDGGGCDVTTSIDVVGEGRVDIVRPTFDARIEIGDHVVAPFSPLTVPVLWTRDVTAANIDSVRFVIDHLYFLFAVDSVRVAMDLGAVVESVVEPGRTAITLRRDIGATRPFGGTDTLCWLIGVSGPGIPDSTDFRIRDVEIGAQETTTHSVRNGTLIVDACGPRFLVNFRQPAVVRINQDGQNIVLNVDAMEDDVLRWDVITLEGKQITHGETNVSEGHSYHLLDMSTVSSSVVVVRCTTHNGGRYSVLLPIIR